MCFLFRIKVIVLCVEIGVVATVLLVKLSFSAEHIDDITFGIILKLFARSCCFKCKHYSILRIRSILPTIIVFWLLFVK